MKVETAVKLERWFP